MPPSKGSLAKGAAPWKTSSEPILAFFPGLLLHTSLGPLVVPSVRGKPERQGGKARPAVHLSVFFISQPPVSLLLSLSLKATLWQPMSGPHVIHDCSSDSRYSMVQSRAFATPRSPTCHFAWVGPRRHERLMGPKPRPNESRNSLPDKSKKKPSTATSWCMFCRYTYWILLALDQF